MNSSPEYASRARLWLLATWLTLGKGAAAQAILTDDDGTGREELFRSVAAFPPGSRFDIHFRVINAATAGAVLES